MTTKSLQTFGWVLGGRGDNKSALELVLSTGAIFGDRKIQLQVRLRNFKTHLGPDPTLIQISCSIITITPFI